MRARTMLLLVCLLAAATAAPATYDQRQDGDLNIRADVQNVVLLLAYPQKMTIPSSIFNGLIKSSKHASRHQEVQERADVHVMEAFVEPNEPYHVEIGESSRQAEGDGRTVEVVIAGRRRLEDGPQAEQDEYKLLGATEQCGPDRERDPVTLTCRTRSQPVPDDALPEPAPETDQTITDLIANPAPEVVPASS